MKTKLIAATVFALAAMSGASAFAQSYKDNLPFTMSSNLTRAQVQADYLQARKEGTLPQLGETGEYVTVAKAPVASTVTRAEVRAEAIVAARARHNDGDYYLYN
jgi:Domain of unknown function (DUF4148)